MSLQPCLWSWREISLHTTRRIYQSAVRSILLDCYETRPVRVADGRTLGASNFLLACTSPRGFTKWEQFPLKSEYHKHYTALRELKYLVPHGRRPRKCNGTLISTAATSVTTRSSIDFFSFAHSLATLSHKLLATFC